jgi:hypothetical protein
MDDSLLNDKRQKQKWNEKYGKLIDFKENKFTTAGIIDQVQFDEFIDKNKFHVPVIKGPESKPDFSNDVNEYLLKLGIKDTKASTKIKPIGMYDPPKEVRDLIYKGVSKEHEGRYLYLKERQKEAVLF